MASLEFTHRRRNPLTGDWVLVSPHRNNRPWQGATEAAAVQSEPSYDPQCPLCPGNTRANGEANPDYPFTHVFVNDFGALNAETISAHDSNSLASKANGLFTATPATGECRVVCFSPDHSKSLPQMSVAELQKVVEMWCENYTELAQTYACVHVFENKGAMMGCSQPHPHGQIWAHDYLSTEIAQADHHQNAYFNEYGSNLLGDYVQHECRENERIVCENASWLAVVPFWAAWPFETLLIAKQDVVDFTELDAQQSADLAAILQQLTIRYDNVFQCSFPYSMGWHNAPAKRSREDNRHWRLHAHFYPPLLRSATVKKHMVGYEMLAESQRDLTPETAADILRSVSNVHYKAHQHAHESRCNLKEQS